MVYGQKVLDQIFRRQASIPTLAGRMRRVVQIGAVDIVDDRIEALENIRGVLLEGCMRWSGFMRYPFLRPGGDERGIHVRHRTGSADQIDA